jgi:hypothetical protein
VGDLRLGAGRWDLRANTWMHFFEVAAKIRTATSEELSSLRTATSEELSSPLTGGMEWSVSQRSPMCSRSNPKNRPAVASCMITRNSSWKSVSWIDFVCVQVGPRDGGGVACVGREIRKEKCVPGVRVCLCARVCICMRDERTSSVCERERRKGEICGECARACVCACKRERKRSVRACREKGR